MSPDETSETPLAGRLAVVVGALGRLGPVWCGALAEAGATVVGVDVATGESGPCAVLLGADVTDREEVDRAARAVEVRFGVPDVLVLSAGIDQPPDAAAETARIEEVSSEAFRGTLETNLLGAFHCLQAFGARMAAAGRGSIVSVGSIYATVAADPGLYDHLEVDPPFLKPPAYGASKAGVLNLTRYFARLWGPNGVRVNAISPGGFSAGQDPEFVRKYSARVPLARLAEPGDLTGPLVFLASEASAYVTGQELRVDGGFCI